MLLRSFSASSSLGIFLFLSVIALLFAASSTVLMSVAGSDTLIASRASVVPNLSASSNVGLCLEWTLLK